MMMCLKEKEPLVPMSQRERRTSADAGLEEKEPLISVGRQTSIFFYSEAGVVIEPGEVCPCRHSSISYQVAGLASHPPAVAGTMFSAVADPSDTFQAGLFHGDVCALTSPLPLRKRESSLGFWMLTLRQSTTTNQRNPTQHTRH